ncbi:MAG: hypothetical protein BWY26_00554 [Elusimicrobia bacterium ADurb.Bin231]|nr:MAG: hypothetical protein BWY26_00554 [Elusimicrobia bacterium ADurb.Bin231]
MEKIIKISNHSINYGISRRDIKYPRLEFKTGRLLLVLPNGMKNEADILTRHRSWINKKSSFINKTLKNSKSSMLDLKRTDAELHIIVNRLVKKYSKESELKINKIYFKKMKSKWASMSSKKNLTVNLLLKFLPVRLVNYVIYHEVTHLLEKKHNDRFFRLISKKYKNYKSIEASLFKYWFSIKQNFEKLV